MVTTLRQKCEIIYHMLNQVKIFTLLSPFAYIMEVHYSKGAASGTKFSCSLIPLP